jgi:hypothetical protein
MTTPRLVPLRRITLVQPPVDRHPARRDPLHGAVQACTATTFRASLDHTESAVAAMDPGDPHPGPVQMYGPEPMRAPRWLLFVAGVAIGSVVSVWVMLP